MDMRNAKEIVTSATHTHPLTTTHHLLPTRQHTHVSQARRIFRLAVCDTVHSPVSACFILAPNANGEMRKKKGGVVRQQQPSVPRLVSNCAAYATGCSGYLFWSRRNDEIKRGMGFSVPTAAVCTVYSVTLPRTQIVPLDAPLLPPHAGERRLPTPSALFLFFSFVVE